ncbi:MAG: transglycosylase SLT domain-containing protein [Bdellovibrionota bacterium]
MSIIKRKKKAHKAPKPVKSKQIHGWRVCPYGEHWVRTHPMHIPPSKSHPAGYVTTRHAHCARNPSGKDQLYPDEIREIASNHFKNLKNKPCPMTLNFLNGNKFDDLIAGWTQYWNEVMQPKVPLDPNLVKALIASESSFKAAILANEKNSNSARGLMQITNDTRKILGDEAGELKDHYITATKDDLNNPSVNICAGVRWLIRKQSIASSKLKHNATWIEAVYEYKGLETADKKRRDELWDTFKKLYEAYKQCGK